MEIAMPMRRFLFLSLLGVAAASPALAEEQKLTLLSMNMWGAGANAQKPIAKARVFDVSFDVIFRVYRCMQQLCKLQIAK